MADESQGPLTYGIQHKARCLVPQSGNTEVLHHNSAFLLGTCSVRGGNQIHLIMVNEEDEEITCVNVFATPSEVVALQASPENADLLAISSGASGNAAQVCKMFNDERNPRLDQVCELKKASWLLWEEPAESTIVSGKDSLADIWDVGQSDSKLKTSVDLSALDSPIKGPILDAHWNPHFAGMLGLCHGTCMSGFDVRSNKVAWNINTNTETTRSLSFNPNKPYVLCSGGNSRELQFWDYRKCDEGPLLVEESLRPQISSLHTHWIQKVAYNPHHDSLIISAGSDALCSLWKVSSLSSEPASAQDYLINDYKGHSDSIYSAVWSAAEAWVFASLSYDGKVVVQHVNDEEKLKILL